MQVTLGMAIREARMRKRWTQVELAQKIPVHVRMPGYWENDEREPDLTTLRRLVQLFDDTAFTLAAARTVTDGLIGSTADALSGVRTAAAIAMAHELEELRDDLACVKSELLRCPSMANRDVVESVGANILDVVLTCHQFLVELDRDYDLPLPTIRRRHLKEVRQKGYIAAKANGRPLARTA